MTASFSGDDRHLTLQDLQESEFDLLVIGGGITGAGIALDAQSRGLKTALVEMQDFAAGTSSRSTKLVHGGLRYLKQYEVKMVAEVGKERAIVYENGPHVTTPERMLLPFYKGGTFGRFSTSFGLLVYDLLAGVKRNERRKMFSARETLRREPLLKKEGLLGGGHYVEYRTDDARLTIEVLKKAVKYGTTAVNYAKVQSFLYEDGVVAGVRISDELAGGGEYTVRAGKIVNASGPWVDMLRDMDGSKQGKTLHLTKGVHLVFDAARFPLRQAIYFDTPDGRMVFAIPRDGKTYIGTTDTDYHGDLATPRMTDADRAYLLRAANGMFPGLKLTETDVESSWAGLRPLIHEEGKDPSEISRRDEILIAPSGLISIAGGKLTGYRKMAESIVDRVCRMRSEELGKRLPECITKHLPISGGEVGGSEHFPAYVKRMTAEGVGCGLSEAHAKKLVCRYGSNVGRIFARVQDSREPAEPLRLPLVLLAVLDYSIEEEMVMKPVDFFIRRTGSLYFEMEWVKKWKDPVVDYMGKRFGWTEEQKETYTNEMERSLKEAVVPLY